MNYFIRTLVFFSLVVCTLHENCSLPCYGCVYFLLVLYQHLFASCRQSPWKISHLIGLQLKNYYNATYTIIISLIRVHSSAFQICMNPISSSHYRHSNSAITTTSLNQYHLNTDDFPRVHTSSSEEKPTNFSNCFPRFEPYRVKVQPILQDYSVVVPCILLPDVMCGERVFIFHGVPCFGDTERGDDELPYRLGDNRNSMLWKIECDLGCRRK